MNRLNIDKSLYWINLLFMLYLFVQFELKLIDELQVICSEPLISGDIRVNAPTQILFGSEKFGIDIYIFPILSLYIMGKRFTLQENDYSIGYIPSIILKISWNICEDIKCNRIASLIISVIYLVLISSALVKIYGFSSAILGTWYAILFMSYGMQPANSEMIFPNMCILASTLTFIKLHSYYKTGQKKYLIHALISSIFSLNFHTLWGIIINMCTFAGFLSRKILMAFKTIGFKEILKFLLVFLILTFPMLIYLLIPSEIKWKTTSYQISLDISMNLNNIYQHIKFFSGKHFINSISFFLIPSIILIFSRNFRKTIEYRAPVLSSTLLFISIFTILSLLESKKLSTTDIFLRSVKYVNFYTPFVISTIVSYSLIFLKKRNIPYLLKLATRLSIVVLMNLSIYKLLVGDDQHNHKPERNMTKSNNFLTDNIRDLIGESLISLESQRELTDYLLKKNIYIPYAIVPVISAGGFIDILSKDKIKAIYLPCIDEINDMKIISISNLISLYMKNIIRKYRKYLNSTGDKFLIVDHSCKDTLNIRKHSMNLIHEIKDRKTGETVYYIYELTIQDHPNESKFPKSQ